MTITEAPWRLSLEGEVIMCELECLSPQALNLLCEGTIDAVCSHFDDRDSSFLVTDNSRRVWRRRRDQHVANPDDQIWTTRIVRDLPTRAIIGRGGFHAKPDERGMVEIGYAIAPKFHRQGYGSAVVKVLLKVARGDARVKVVRASIRPDNWISRKIVTGYRFKKVGEQIDEEDGLEEIFECPM